MPGGDPFGQVVPEFEGANRPASGAPSTLGGAMEEPEPEPEPEPPAQLGRLPTEPEPEPEAARAALGRYMVISTATLRAGPESSSAKIGEHSKGTVIEVVQEMTNGKGLTVLQTITPPSGSSHGGWLKVMTSKGRALVKPWNEPEPEPAAAEGRKKGRRMSLTFGMSFPTEGEPPKDGNGNGNGKKNGGRRRMSITLGRGDSSPSPERDGHGSLASPPEFGRRGSITSPHSPPEFGRGGVGQLGRGSVSELLSATLRDHDDAPDEGVAPGLGRFTATANGVIRKSHEMDSDKLGTLQKGEEIEALDIRTVGKVARIRYAAGWVSMSSSKTGRVLLAPVKKGAGAVVRPNTDRVRVLLPVS